MTLLEAIDWCRREKATVFFNKAKVTVLLAGKSTSSVLSLEEAVEVFDSLLGSSVTDEGKIGEPN